MQNEENDSIENYHQFWLFYLGQHAKRATKIIHTVGLLVGLAVAFYGASTKTWFLIPGSVVLTYAALWASHFWVEKNIPATFKWPVWSFVSEFRLAWRTLTGKI